MPRLALLALLFCLLLAAPALGVAPLWTHNATQPVRAVSLSADGNLTGVGSDYLHIFNRTGDLIVTSFAPNDVAVVPDGSLVVSGTGDTVYAFAPNGTELWSQPNATAALAAADDGGTIAVLGVQGDLSFYDMDGAVINTVEADEKGRGVDVAVSRSGSFVAAAYDRGIRVFSGYGGERWDLELAGAYAIAVNSTGSLVAVGDGGSVKFYNQTGERLGRVLTGGPVRSLAMTPDTNMTVAGAEDGSVLVFEGNGTLRWQRMVGEGRTRVAVSEGGSVVAAASGKRALLVYDRNGTLLWEAPLGAPPRSLALSADGTTLAVGCDDGTASVFSTGVTPMPKPTKAPRNTTGARNATSNRTATAGSGTGSGTSGQAAGNMTVNGDLTVEGNLTVGGDLTATGYVAARTNATAEDGPTGERNATAPGNATAPRNRTAAENLTGAGNMTVEGDSTLEENSTAGGGDLTADEALEAPGDATAAVNSTDEENITAPGTTTAAANATAARNGTAAARPAAPDDVTTAGDLSVVGDFTVGGDLTVMGNVTTGGELRVAGTLAAEEEAPAADVTAAENETWAVRPAETVPVAETTTGAGRQSAWRPSLPWGAAAPAPAGEAGAETANASESPASRPSPAGNASGQTPYGDLPSLPGTVQAEDYDLGGPDVAYWDSTPGNRVTANVAYRPNESVDAETIGGSSNVGWITDGEWTEYTVNVTDGGAYYATFRAGAWANDRRIVLTVDGAPGCEVAVPNLGSVGAYREVSAPLSLPAGRHVIRLTYRGDGMNVDWFRVGPGSLALQAGSPLPLAAGVVLALAAAVTLRRRD